MTDRRRLPLVYLAALALVLAVPSLVRAQTVNLTVLHVNDVYEISPKDGRGGFAELMTLLRQERALAQHHVTTLGGDMVGSSMMSGITKGTQMIELANAIGLDIAVVGNHEFDFGPEIFRQRVAESKFPWLASNMTGADGKPIPGTQVNVIRQIGGINVGFFGVITPETDSLSTPGKDTKFAAPIEVAKAQVKELRDKGADVVIALTHLTLTEDRTLAKQVPGISAILGGHDHDPMTVYEGGVIIHKSGYDAHYLGVINLLIDKKPSDRGPRVTVTPVAWRMVSTIGVKPDPELAALVKKHEDKLSADLQVPVGKTAVALDSRRATVRLKEAAIGNLIADAIRDAVKADVSLTNGGGIRGDKLYEAGATLTRKDVFTELPFGNLNVLIELKGADLLTALEQGVSQVEDTAGRFPQVSGLSFTFDPKAAKMSRVSEVKVGGQPLDPNKIYKVAVNDYMFAGGDGYAALTKGKAIIDASGAALMANVVMDYIAKKATVEPKVEGRIVEKK